MKENFSFFGCVGMTRHLHRCQCTNYTLFLLSFAEETLTIGVIKMEWFMHVLL